MTNGQQEGDARSALTFSVRAADGADLDRTEATPTGRGLRFTCTCSDGTERRHCDDRVALLLSDASALIKSGETSVNFLSVMAEAAMAEAQLDLDRAKRVIATILQG